MTLLFAMISAALFGLTVHFARRGLDYLDSLTGTVITVLTIAGIFWALAPFSIDAAWWNTRAALLFAACGLVYPALSQQTQVMAVEKLGTALGAALGSVSPAFAAVLAVMLLGETLTPRIVAGILLMIAAGVLSSVGRAGIPRNWPLWALWLPVAASAFRGVTQPVSKIGLLEIPSPFFSVLVMSSVSAVVVILLRLAQRRPWPLPAIRRGLPWFMANGAASGFGILALFAAIESGEVVIAAPLVSTTPLWTLLFGWLVFRREVLDSRHLAVAVLVVLGVVLIVTR